MGKLSRTKGAAWEREVAAKIREVVGVDAVRNLEECRDGNRGDIKSSLPVSWQCKVGARPDIYSAVKEAQEAGKPTDYAVAITKRNAKGKQGPVELATLPLEDFLDILHLIYGSGLW